MESDLRSILHTMACRLRQAASLPHWGFVVRTDGPRAAIDLYSSDLPLNEINALFLAWLRVKESGWNLPDFNPLPWAPEVVSAQVVPFSEDRNHGGVAVRFLVEA